ncbi:hypothetical protein ACFSKM_16980 [Ancylobacter dichloromethanicus]
MSALLVFTHLLAFLVGGFCGVLVLALGRVVHDDDPEEGGAAARHPTNCPTCGRRCAAAEAEANAPSI